MKLDNIWQRINALVPDPKCRTRGNKITEWKDERQQPSEEELLAVDLTTIKNPQELLWEEFDEAKTIASLKTVLEKFLRR